ncbi:MAG: hypothetical protein AAF078_12675 [Planctomycetota bacterium]
MTQFLRRQSLRAAAILCVVAGIQSAAEAGTVQVERAENGLLTKNHYGSVYLHWDTGVTTRTGKQAAGPFSLLIDGDPHYTFCVDLDHTMNIPKNGGREYNMMGTLNDHAGFSESQVGLVESMFEMYYDIATSAQDGTSKSREKAEGTAFQIVLWEMLVDDTFDLTQGDFHLQTERNHGFTDTVYDIATDWASTLSADGFSNPGFELRYIDTPSSQGQVYMVDSLTVVPSPVAASGVLVGMMLVAGRRHRALRGADEGEV